MSGAFYKRFVPPPNSSTKNASPASSAALNSRSKHATDAFNASAHPTKRKDDTKKGRSKQNNPVQRDTDDIVDRGTSHRSTESPVASRKAKKRKRESNINEQSHEEDQTIPKKHKAVFSKFEKAAKRAVTVQSVATETADDAGQVEKAEEELHDLRPLPQPAPVPDAPFEPTFSTLPKWLAKPITVESSKTVPFTELGVHETFRKKLEKQGFKDALAVQSILLPMLHPGFDQHLGDICVSARTGSGKTLAYLLPIVEALKDQAVTTLSAIIVVPTRQLVDQALKVAEELCIGTKLKVGTALGSVPLATEQRQLVKMRAQYDPQRAEELQEKASRQLSTSLSERGSIFDDLATVPRNHVPQYESGVDILICTPGRLVEHIDSTTGFLLRSVRWLVIDEADQLLTQNFQGWATILTDALHSETPEDFMSAQEILRKKRLGSSWSMALPAQRQITKVILSATMKKDLTKLGILRLRRPKLVVVEEDAEELEIMADGDVFEVPSTMTEFAIPVGDGSRKPLYLLYLLLDKMWKTRDSGAIPVSNDSGESDSDSSSEASDRKGGKRLTTSGMVSRVLIFTKSNESASRLSHLLSVLEPSLRESIQTMAPAATAKQIQKVLKAFTTGKIKILIASDVASRGLDIPDISHVVNYDMPSSITSYVHRVGRTARAGKEGQAWTLVTKPEAGWFWNQIAKGGNVKRGNKKVTRVEYTEKQVTWDRKRTYQEALQELQGAVEGTDDAP